MVVVSSLVLVGLASPPVGSQQVGPPAGNWHGYFHYFGNAAFDTDEGDVPVVYTATGTFDFVTANGFLNGDYELLVEAELTELGTTANAIASGDLSGPATEPDMILEGTSVSSGVGGIVMELSFTAAELGNPQGKMIPTGGDCSNLYGIWNQEFSLGMEAQGGTVDQLDGTWHAFRDSSMSDGDPGALEAEMTSFSALGQTILNDVRSGTVNTADLRDYLAVAEGAIVSGTRRSNCEEGIDSGSEARFRSLAAATVDDILGEAALGIDSIDDLTFLSLMLSGYRTGSFDEGTDLRDFYEADFERRVDTAMSGGDPDTLRIFLVSATQLGRNDLATDLVDLLGEVGG
jgi:hypothetical protein